MSISFPPRPTENSDPWYSARETYDNAIEDAIESTRRDLSHDLRALAETDGWLAVYDPTDRLSIDTSGLDGRSINSIPDGLGNLPDLEGSVGSRPDWRPDRFGAFAGMYFNGNYSLRAPFVNDIPLHVTIVTLAKSFDPKRSANQYLFDSTTIATTRGCYIRGSDSTWRFIDASTNGLSRHGVPSDYKPHIVTAYFNGEFSNVALDGQLGAIGRHSPTVPTEPITGIQVGSSSFGPNRGWYGEIGPVLIYPGIPSQEVISRMTDLLHGMSGIPYGEPTFSSRSRIYSEDEFGNVTATRGDTTLISRHGIASMTKLMNALTARKYLTTEADLDQTIVFHEDDVNNNTWRAGDIISYRDLIYSEALPSSDATPRSIARNVGQIILNGEGGSGDPIQRFVDEMNDFGVEIGLTSAAFGTPAHTSFVSPQDMVKMMKYARQDPALVEIFGSTTRAITVGGPEARTFTVNSTVISNSIAEIPGYVMGKGGGALSAQHLIITWKDSRGVEHTTSIQDAHLGTNERSEDLFSLMVHQNNGAEKKVEIAGGLTGQQLTHRLRGVTPSSSDIDRMHGSAWTGIWSFTGSIQPINMPFNTSFAGIIEIIDGGLNNAIKQVVTTQTECWWREAGNVDTGIGWGQWNRVPTGEEIAALEEKFHGSQLPDGTNLDGLIESAYYQLPQARTYMNIPAVVDQSTISAGIRVTKYTENSLLAASQELICGNLMFYRTISNTVYPNITWRSWNQVGRSLVSVANEEPYSG